MPESGFAWRRIAKRASISPQRFAFFLLSLLFLVNTPWLHGLCERAGDYALILLQTDRASEFQALEGAYSRFHFRHPAPTYFYWYALLSPRFYWTNSAQGAVAGCQFLLNALFLWGTVNALGKSLPQESRAALAPYCLTILSLFLCLAQSPDFLFDPWGPVTVVLPFLAALLGLSVLSSGNNSALFLTAAGSVFSVSNHVSTAFILIPLSLLSMALARTAPKMRRIRATRTQIAGTVLIVILPTIPVIIESFSSPGGGNVTDLWNFFLYSPPSSSRPLYEVFEYLSQYFILAFGAAAGPASIGFTAAIVAVALYTSYRTEAVLKNLVWLSCAALFGMVFIARAMPGKLHSYVLLYAAAIVASMLTVVATTLLSRLAITRTIPASRIGTWLSIVFGTILLCTSYQTARACGGKYGNLLHQLSVAPGTPIQVSPPSAQAWIPFATLTSLMYRKGYSPCVEPEWEFMFTSALVCKESPLQKITVGTKRDMAGVDSSAHFSGDLVALKTSRTATN